VAVADRAQERRYRGAGRQTKTNEGEVADLPGGELGVKDPPARDPLAEPCPWLRLRCHGPPVGPVGRGSVTHFRGEHL